MLNVFGQTYSAGLSQWWGFHHRRCWKTDTAFKFSSNFPTKKNSCYLLTNQIPTKVPFNLSHLHDSPLYSLITNRMLSFFAPTPLAACRNDMIGRSWTTWQPVGWCRVCNLFCFILLLLLIDMTAFMCYQLHTLHPAAQHLTLYLCLYA